MAGRGSSLAGSPAPGAAAFGGSTGRVPLPPSPAAPRLDRPRWRDSRLIAGVLVLLVSVVAGSRLVTDGGRTSPALVAASDLSAGHVLTDADLRTAGVRLTGAAGGQYLAASQLPAVVGKALRRPVDAGELIPGSAVGSAAAPPTAEVSLAVGQGRHPALAAGDRVDVYATADTPTRPAGQAGGASPGTGQVASACTTVVVATGLEVVDAVSADSDTGVATVVLRVPPQQAAAVVHAGEAATVDLVRDPTTGAVTPPSAPLQAVGPVVTGACATGK